MSQDNKYAKYNNKAVKTVKSKTRRWISLCILKNSVKFKWLVAILIQPPWLAVEKRFSIFESSRL